MRGIALKIFLSFWLIFAVLIATFALMPNRGMGVRFVDHLRQHGAVAAQLLADRGRQSCAEYSAAVASSTGAQFALIDSERKLLCPDVLVPELEDVVRRGSARDAGDNGAMLPVDMPVGRYVFVVGIALPRFNLNLPPPPFPYRAVAFAIVISGLVCFAMARYLARSSGTDEMRSATSFGTSTRWPPGSRRSSTPSISCCPTSPTSSARR
jgi:hypothetical protein